MAATAARAPAACRLDVNLLQPAAAILCNDARGIFVE
jgi:hypothetical protein